MKIEKDRKNGKAESRTGSRISFFSQKIKTGISDLGSIWLKSLNQYRENGRLKLASSIVALSLASVLMAGLFSWLPVPAVLKLGVFSTSNWDVPQSETYRLIDGIIERFEKENPGVAVEYTSGIIKQDYSGWLSDQIVEGETPDVFLVLDEDFNMLASLGALMDLDPFLRKEDLQTEELFFTNAALAGEYNGVSYALPVESNIDLMFVNLDILNEAGISLPDRSWTLDDLTEICRQVTLDQDQDGVVDQFGLAGYGWQEMMEACNVSLFDEAGSRALINTDEVWSALQRLSRLQPYCLESYPQASTGGFDAGNVAFAPMSYADYKTYKPYPWKMKKYSNFDWAILSMPAITSNARRSTLDSLLMGISSETSRPAEAWKLLKMFAFDEYSQSQIMELSAGISPLRAISLSVQNDGNFELFDELLGWALERTQPKLRFKKYEDAMSLLDSGMKQAMSRDGDHDLILLDLQNQISSFLRN